MNFQESRRIMSLHPMFSNYFKIHRTSKLVLAIAADFKDKLVSLEDIYYFAENYKE